MGDDQASDADAKITALRLLLTALDALEGTDAAPLVLPFTITAATQQGLQAVFHQLAGRGIAAMLANATYADGVETEQDERRWVRELLQCELDEVTLEALGGDLG